MNETHTLSPRAEFCPPLPTLLLLTSSSSARRTRFVSRSREVKAEVSVCMELGHNGLVTEVKNLYGEGHMVNVNTSLYIYIQYHVFIMGLININHTDFSIVVWQ